MRRSITAALTAGLLLLALAVPASARPEATGPACADIEPSGVGANYFTEAGTPTVSFNFELSVPSCKSVRYVGYAYAWTGTESITGAELLATGSIAGDGSIDNEIGVAFAVPSGHTDICVYAATESSGGGTFDRAPDTADSCVRLTLDAGSGLSKFG